MGFPVGFVEFCRAVWGDKHGSSIDAAFRVVKNMSEPEKNRIPPQVDWARTLADWSDMHARCRECCGTKYRVDEYWHCPICDRVQSAPGKTNEKEK